MSHNGWLSRVGGDLIAAGMKDFPPPETSGGKALDVEMKVPDLGRVRIRYEASSYSHYRSKFWRWGAVWVDRIDAQGNVVNPS